MTRIAAVQPHHDLLSRLEATSHSRLTRTQLEIDALGEQIAHEASDLGNLACMTGSGLVFRGVGLGLQSLGLARTVAKGAALFSEAVAFRASSNAVTRLRGQSPSEDVFDSRGLVSTLLTFGSLKGVGALAEGQNAVLTNALQASTMVATQNIAYGLGWATEPQGNLTSQFAHALSTNAALSAGQSLLHFATGGSIARAERSLELAEQARNYRPLSLVRETSPLRSPLGVFAAESAQAPGREVPADWPPSIDARWSEVREGTNLWSAEPVSTNRDFVRSINQGVLKLLGEKNVRIQFGYGSGFDKFDPAESVMSREPDNKFDLVVVVNSFEDALSHLGNHWGFEGARTREMIENANKGGVYCPNPDMLVDGFGLLGFKLTIVSAERFYAERNGKPALNFAQFRLKDTIIADSNNPSNRLLWIADSTETPRVQTQIDHVVDHMLDISFRLRGSFAPHLFKPFRFLSRSISVARLVEWMYELSYNIEGYRIFDWGKSKKLFAKRRGEIAPFMLENVRRFIERNAATVQAVYQGKEITSDQITVQNLYDIQLRDRSLAASRARWKDASTYTSLLIDINRQSWLGSKAAMNSLRNSRSYEHIDNSIYGGRKMRKWVHENGAIARVLGRPLLALVRAIKPDKVDSVNYPVLFTDLASQINGLFRDKMINPDEWRVLNAAWMANPAMTHMRDIEILTAFERNISTTDIPVYLKLLTRIARTPYREPAVVEWAEGRLAELENAP